MLNFNQLEVVEQGHSGVSGVYAILHTSGRFYIGSSNDLWRRRQGHLSDLRLGRHYSQQIVSLYESDGRQSLTFLLVEECSRFVKREQYYLDTLEPWRPSVGLNGSKYAHTGSSKLSAEDVMLIRAMRRDEGLTYAEIAQRFPVGSGAIASAVRGETWAHVPGAMPDDAPGAEATRFSDGGGNPSAVLPDEEVVEIRERALNGESIERIHGDFDCRMDVIVRAVTGETYGHLDGAVGLCVSAPPGACKEQPKGAYAGVRHHKAKLTPEDVCEMRRLRRRTGLPFAKIGEMYGVRKRAALRAIQGDTWAHVTDVGPVVDNANRVRKLSESDVIEMRRKRKHGTHTYRQLADEYGVSFKAARKATKGDTWAHLDKVEAPYIHSVHGGD